MEKIKVILDVDPGHDDAVAILLAAKNPRLDLRGITVVAGNQTLDKTLRNTLNVCGLAGLDTPIYSGMSRPLVRDQIVAAGVHGESGLDGVDFPADLNKQVEEEHAVDFIIEEALKYDKELVLIPVGPLTNIAMALLKEPRITKGIKEIVLMGGSAGTGNTTPSAEFNILADPEAAHVVFESGLPITMIGLDVTYQALVYPPVLQRIAEIGSSVSNMVVQSMGFYGSKYLELAGYEAPALHDVCAVGYVIDPSIFGVKEARVDVELARSHTYGRTVCDFRGITGRPMNAKVALEIDKDRLWELLIEALKQY